MASIFETLTTEEEVEYVLPIYRKSGVNYYLIYQDEVTEKNRMIKVGNATTFKAISISPFPGNGLQTISETTESDQTEFETAYEALKGDLDDLVGV